MARVIEMPKLSDTMEEGGIANWLKKEGDSIKEGEALVEIETDKATQEFESPEEGILLKILVPTGKTVALRTPIAVVGEKGEKVDPAAYSGGAGATATPPAGPAAAAKAPGGGESPANAATKPTASSQAAASSPAKLAGGASPGGAPNSAHAPTAPAPGKASNDAHSAEGGHDSGRVRSSPLARKVAADRGIDVAQLHGSGPGGRVVVRDLGDAAVGAAQSQQASTSANANATAKDKASTYGAGPATAGGRSVPVSMMRKTIAKRLTAAKNDAPHFYLTVSAAVGRLEEWRQQLNAAAQKAAKPGGPAAAKVSLNDAVILAAARALRLHPMVNASWQGDTIMQNAAAHIAIAVALPEGLVTPVIRHAEVLGVREIAAAARELAGKANDGGLSNDAYSGGTFTISNLGMFGIEEFTAIINPPQAAILAVGAAVPTPWVDEHGRVVVQQRMKMTLSCDHRVVDGATGAKFLQTLVSYLEEPLQMLV